MSVFWHVLRRPQLLTRDIFIASKLLRSHFAMWQKKTRPSWQVAQAQRLEDRRADVREIFDAWHGRSQKDDKKSWHKSSSTGWSSWWQWQEGEWWGSDKRATDHSRPEDVLRAHQDAEPTASSWEVQSPGKWLHPKRTPEQDLEDFRDLTLSPSSFQPQRHYMMALGRPVAVPLCCRPIVCCGPLL